MIRNPQIQIHTINPINQGIYGMLCQLSQHATQILNAFVEGKKATIFTNLDNAEDSQQVYYMNELMRRLGYKMHLVDMEKGKIMLMKDKKIVDTVRPMSTISDNLRFDCGKEIDETIVDVSLQDVTDITTEIKKGEISQQTEQRFF